MIYVSQLIIRYPMNTTYWTGWPSKDKPYGFPHSWQQELMKTLFCLATNRRGIATAIAKRTQQGPRRALERNIQRPARPYPRGCRASELDRR